MEIKIKLDDNDTADKYIERLLAVLERIADALEDEPEGSDDG
jgi:predicted RNA-binding protein with PIN domain